MSMIDHLEPGSPLWRYETVHSSPLPIAQRQVLYVLASHCSSGIKGRTWVSMKLLCKRSNMSERTVFRVLAKLTDAGIVQRVTNDEGNRAFDVDWEAVLAPALKSVKSAKLAPNTAKLAAKTTKTDEDGTANLAVNTANVTVNTANVAVNTAKLAAPIRSNQEPTKNQPRTKKSKPSLIPDWKFSLGDGVKASKVSKEAAEVFEYWWIRRKKASGQPSKLTAQSLRQLNGALKRHSTKDLKHYVRWAIEAQPPHIEEGFAWGWRKGCPVPMFSLLFRSSRISEHLETALRWDPDKARPGPSLVDPEPPKPVVRQAGAELAWAELLASVVGSGGLKSSLYRGMLSGLPSRSAELWEGVERCGGWDEVCRMVARSRSMPDAWSTWWTEREAA